MLELEVKDSVSTSDAATSGEKLIKEIAAATFILK